MQNTDSLWLLCTIIMTVACCVLAVPKPCGVRNGMCEHLCLLTRNTEDTGLGYRCGCQVGHHLRPDKMECEQVKEFLMYSQQKFIKGQVSGVYGPVGVLLENHGGPCKIKLIHRHFMGPKKLQKIILQKLYNVDVFK